MMRVPLYARILGWFFANLLLLAAGLLVFVHGYFGVGLGALMAGRAGDQVDTASRLILEEIRGKRPDEWGGVLRRYGAAYGVTFTLLGPRGEWIAGGLHEIPPGVLEEIRRQRDPAPPPPDRGEGAGAPPPPPRALIQTANPLRYWAVLRVRLPGMRPPAPPAALVIESASLNAGGLFFDVRPWLYLAAAGVVLSALLWLPFVGGITRAIRKMSDGTARLAEGNFGEPVPVRRADELGALAEAINRMGERLDGYVSGQRRFLGDIAHELCAPLARMQMALGILEAKADEGQRERLGDLREEADQMSALVNELMSFSKASLGGPKPKARAVGLRTVAERAVQRESPGTTRVAVDVPADLRALADPDLLERALANLVRNALRHAGEAGPITVGAERAGDHVRLAVRDCGPGVPAAMIEQVFDPFFRVDASRTRDTGGVGLGLAIVKTCVTSCGGTVAARNLEPRGFEVTIRLAAAGEAT